MQMFYLNSVLFEIEMLRAEFMSEKERNARKENYLNSETREVNVGGKSISPYALRRDSQPGMKNILLKGQMRYIEDIKATIYLCSPV